MGKSGGIGEQAPAQGGAVPGAGGGPERAAGTAGDVLAGTGPVAAAGGAAPDATGAAMAGTAPEDDGLAAGTGGEPAGPGVAAAAAGPAEGLPAEPVAGEVPAGEAVSEPVWRDIPAGDALAEPVAGGAPAGDIFAEPVVRVIRAEDPTVEPAAGTAPAGDAFAGPVVRAVPAGDVPAGPVAERLPAGDTSAEWVAGVAPAGPVAGGGSLAGAPAGPVAGGAAVGPGAAGAGAAGAGGLPAGVPGPAAASVAAGGARRRGTAMERAGGGAPPRKGKARRSWGWRLARALVWACVAVMLVTGALAGGAALFSGRPLALPVWAVAEAEARLNRALGGQAVVSIGGLEVALDPSRLPELRLQDLRLGRPGGGGILLLPEAQARFSGAALLRGRVEPVAVRLTGAQIALRRAPDGRLDFDLGDGGAAPGDLAEVLERIDAFFALAPFATLRTVEAQAMTFSLDDRRAGRVWTVGDGRVALVRSPEETVLEVGMALVGGGAGPATAQLRFGILHGGQGARLAARVDGVAAADIAAQTPLLGWLGVLDAPISGDLRAELAGDGAVAGLEGSLAIGPGALSPVEGAQPLPIRSAEIVFGYDPAKARITASRLAVDSPALRVTASAHADLTGAAPTAPEAFVAQIRVGDLVLNPEGMFAEPVRFSEGAMDMRLRLDPFSVELGQLSLVEDGRHLLARGGVQAGPQGWTVAVDLELDAIRHDRLMALWPVGLVPRTRDWLVTNVQEGLLFDVKAGVRIRPGQETRLSLGYEFEDADVRFMPTLPPIQGGRGYATIEGQTYTTVVEDGQVTPPMGGRIDVARSVFRVPDINAKPAPAEITLHTDSSVTAALSLLDQPPFGFLRKAGLPPDLGEGRARLVTELRLPLAAKLKVEEVDFTVTGALTDLRSDRLVPGKVLVAERLELKADPSSVTIAGPGRLGQAAFEARWTQPLGPGKSGSRVEGTVTLDKAAAAEFLAGLGGDAVSGTGRAEFMVDLPRGQAPLLALRSDLAGVGVRIAELGWSKAPGAKGRLEVQGSLRAPVRLDRVVLQGPGLGAEGSVQLAADGGLERMALSHLRIGDWLDVQAELLGQGRGKPPVARVTGGTADLRQLAKGGGGGAGGTAPLEVTLDRVQISNTLALTGARARLSGGTGLDGPFSGMLNGKAAVAGRMVPGPRGTAFRVQAADGGAVLAAAGLFAKASGGKLDLVLSPTAAPGTYEGSFGMTGFLVRDMPVLAELLNAVSIVGLIDQLATSGLVFSEAKGGFLLTPAAVELREGRAVGASFGVSLEGVYAMAEDRLDLRGVISPFYLINGIGSVLTRPGEGLVGFTYRIRGRAGDPQVSVNPLSVLAPGFFRDLLRRPAARISQ